MTQRQYPAIGVHAFAAGGLASGALRYAAEVGAEAMQVPPFIVETPGPKAAQTADVATSKRLRDGEGISAVTLAPPVGHKSPR